MRRNKRTARALWQRCDTSAFHKISKKKKNPKVYIWKHMHIVKVKKIKKPPKNEQKICISDAVMFNAYYERIENGTSYY